MRRIPIVLALLPLSGCLTSALWAPDPVVYSADLREAGFAVEAIGLRLEEASEPETGPAAALVLRATRTHGRCAGGLEQALAGPAWFALRPEHAEQAFAIEELLAVERLGPVGRCAIELQWTWTHAGEQVFDGRLEIGGEFWPGLCRCAIDEAEALVLLSSSATVVAEGVGAPELPRCIAAAERIDWRVLLPFADDGTGQVLGCLAPRSECGAATDDIEAIDLLVRVGRAPPHRYLRVPAVVTPTLACVERDPGTLLDRFVLRTPCRAELVAEPRSFVPLCAPPPGTGLSLVSNVEGIGNRTGLLEKVLVTPFTVVIDSVVAVLMHGRWPRDPPPAAGANGHR